MYFALLCLLNGVISPSIKVAYEVFVNLTFCFVLLYNTKISAIDVG